MASTAGGHNHAREARIICPVAGLRPGAGVPPRRNPRRHFCEGASAGLLTSSVAGAPRPLRPDDPERYSDRLLDSLALATDVA